MKLTLTSTGAEVTSVASVYLQGLHRMGLLYFCLSRGTKHGGHFRLSFLFLSSLRLIPGVAAGHCPLRVTLMHSPLLALSHLQYFFVSSALNCGFRFRFALQM